jgi:uncharacterized damage-inducible protein DinB
MRRVPYTGGEKESLHASLDRHRDVVLWKIEGLDDEQLRRPMVPSGTTLLGLVKHLASVEYSWFCQTFGRETEPLPFDDDDENADLRVAAHESTEDIRAFYARARATPATWTSCESSSTGLPVITHWTNGLAENPLTSLPTAPHRPRCPTAAATRAVCPIA